MTQAAEPAGAPLYGRAAGGDQGSGAGTAATGQGCQQAAPALEPGLSGQELDVLAEASIIGILSTAPEPLSASSIMLRIDEGYRLAVLPALGRLAFLGAAEQVGTRDGIQGWRLTPVPAGPW